MPPKRSKSKTSKTARPATRSTPHPDNEEAMMDTEEAAAGPTAAAAAADDDDEQPGPTTATAIIEAPPSPSGKPMYLERLVFETAKELQPSLEAMVNRISDQFDIYASYNAFIRRCIIDQVRNVLAAAVARRETSADDLDDVADAGAGAGNGNSSDDDSADEEDPMPEDELPGDVLLKRLECLTSADFGLDRNKDERITNEYFSSQGQCKVTSAPTGWGKTITSAIEIAIRFVLWQNVMQDAPVPTLFQVRDTCADSVCGCMATVLERMLGDSGIMPKDVPFAKVIGNKKAVAELTTQDSSIDFGNHPLVYVVTNSAAKTLLNSVGIFKVQWSELERSIESLQVLRDNQELWPNMQEGHHEDMIDRLIDYFECLCVNKPKGRTQTAAILHCDPSWTAINLNQDQRTKEHTVGISTATAMDYVLELIGAQREREERDETHVRVSRSNRKVRTKPLFGKELHALLSNLKPGPERGTPTSTCLLDAMLWSPFSMTIMDEAHTLKSSYIRPKDGGDAGDGDDEDDQRHKIPMPLVHRSEKYAFYVLRLLRGPVTLMSATFSQRMLGYLGEDEEDDEDERAAAFDALTVSDRALISAVNQEDTRLFKVTTEEHAEELKSAAKKPPGIELEVEVIPVTEGFDVTKTSFETPVAKSITTSKAEDAISVANEVVCPAVAWARFSSSHPKNFGNAIGVESHYQERGDDLPRLMEAISGQLQGRDPVTDRVTALAQRAMDGKASGSQQQQRINIAVVCDNKSVHPLTDALTAAFRDAYVLDSVPELGKKSEHQHNLDMAKEEELPDGKTVFILVSSRNLNANGVNAPGFDQVILTPDYNAIKPQTPDEMWQLMSRFNRVDDERASVKITSVVLENEEHQILPIHSPSAAVLTEIRDRDPETLDPQDISWITRIKYSHKDAEDAAAAAKKGPNFEAIFGSEVLAGDYKARLARVIEFCKQTVARFKEEDKLAREEKERAAGKRTIAKASKTMRMTMYQPLMAKRRRRKEQKPSKRKRKPDSYSSPSSSRKQRRRETSYEDDTDESDVDMQDADDKHRSYSAAYNNEEDSSESESEDEEVARRRRHREQKAKDRKRKQQQQGKKDKKRPRTNFV